MPCPVLNRAGSLKYSTVRRHAPAPLPNVVPLGHAWPGRDGCVDEARATGGPGACREALLSLGATADRIDTYCQVVTEIRDLALHEGPVDALENVAAMAEVTQEDGPDWWGRTTTDDVLAWAIVNEQLWNGPHAQDVTYTGLRATRHGWAIAAAGLSALDLARHGLSFGFEELAVMAALRHIHVPALAPGEVFEPPTGVFVEPVQEPLRFGDAPGWWWRKERRMVGDPVIGPLLPAPWDR